MRRRTALSREENDKCIGSFRKFAIETNCVITINGFTTVTLLDLLIKYAEMTKHEHLPLFDI